MRVTVQSQDLIDALKSSAVARSTTQPVLTHVLLRTAGSELIVEATDLDARTVIAIPAQIDEAGDALLPADRLAAAAGGGGTVVLHGDGRVTRGRSRFQLDALPPQDFPGEAEDLQFQPVTGSGRALGKALEEVGYAPDDGDMRPGCRGVALEPGFVSATDGKRIARVAADYQGPNVLIPVKQLPRLKGLLNDASVVEVGNVRGPRAGKFRVQSGNHSLTLTCLDADPLPVGKVIEGVNFGEASVVVQRRELLDAVRRFSPFVMHYAKGDKGVVLVRSGDTLSIRDSTDGSNAEDVSDLVASAKGGDFAVGLSHRYLVDTLGAIAEDRVEIYPDPRVVNVFLPEGGDVRNVAHLVAPQIV